jgi:hypothetical protein
MARANKKGQMTVFVIIAVVLVASIVLFLFINTKSPRINPAENNPGSAIKSCVKDVVENNVNLIIPNAGFMEVENYKLYHGMKIMYLCQNIGNYIPCINQHPMLINEIQKEILDYSNEGIKKCFSDAKQSLEKANNVVSMSSINASIGLAPGRVKTEIGAKIQFSKGEQSTTIEDFDINLNSPIYDLANLAMIIANEQAKYCYFEYAGYMMLHPEIKIEVDTLSDATRIYTLTDKVSSKKMYFAIRSCAIPAGA